MQLYRNIGVSDIRRPNGVVVAPNEVFEPTEKEVTYMENAMWLGNRVKEVSADEVQAELNAGASTLAVNDPAVPKQWTLKVSPEDYLKRHPDGPQAEFARKLLSDATVTVSQ